MMLLPTVAKMEILYPPNLYVHPKIGFVRAETPRRLRIGSGLRRTRIRAPFHEIGFVRANFELVGGPHSASTSTSKNWVRSREIGF